MKKIKKVFAIVALVYIFSGCGTKKQEDPILKERQIELRQEVKNDTEQGWPKLEKISVELNRHIDGDTTDFILDNQRIRVRYLLIDTPETVKKDTQVQPFGIEASNRTKELLETAESLSIMFDEGQNEDKYGRYLAYVFVDDELLQDILIREGLAKISYVEAPNTYFLDKLILSEEQAKKENLGVWIEQSKK